MLPDDVYCSRCSGTLEARVIDGVERPACSTCEKVIYHDPKVSAVAVVEHDGKVLMVQRALEPGIGLWSLPGGYVDRGEVVERAVEREVAEETSLEIEATDLLAVSSEPGNQVILISYDSRFIGGELKGGPEVSDASFFDPSDLPPLAFPRDRQILETWKNRRDGKR
ncbi:MAG: NUDIX hydrolase [Dehalococcoidia bacterium]|nr:NUDIX hydrolase [Dehalococcoidia bacterium]